MGQETFASPVSRAVLARTYKELGQVDTALEMLLALRADYGGPEETEVIATADADLADLYLWLAQPELAASVLRELPDDASPTMKRGDAVIRSRLAMAAGDTERADGHLDKALAAAVAEGGAYGRFVVHAERTRVLPARQGAALAEQEAAASHAMGLALTTWPLRVMACRAWLACGESARAVDAARSIAAYFADRPVFVLYPPEVWVVVGEAFQSAGIATQARDAFGRAKRWVNEVMASRIRQPCATSTCGSTRSTAGWLRSAPWPGPETPRLAEGMVRAYLVGNRVAGFGHQAVNALHPTAAHACSQADRGPLQNGGTRWPWVPAVGDGEKTAVMTRLA